MNFLGRFLKILFVALLFSAIGGLIFYMTVISGNKLRSDISQEEFVSTVRRVVGGWLGFIIFLSFLLAVTGMKKSFTVAFNDRNAFRHSVHQAITSLRYRPQTQTESLLVYRPPRMGGLLAEKISVELEQDRALITAPAGILKRIRGRIQA